MPNAQNSTNRQEKKTVILDKINQLVSEDGFKTNVKVSLATSNYFYIGTAIIISGFILIVISLVIMKLTKKLGS